MNQSLYDLTNDELEVFDLLSDPDVSDEEKQGIVTRYLQSGTQEQLKGKLLAYARMLRNKQAEAKICREEAKNFTDRARSCDSLVEKLKAGLMYYMEAHDLEQVEVTPFKVKLQSNGGVQPLIIAIDPKELPPIYQKIEADAEAIRADLEAGETIPGCSLGERGKHVRVL